MRNILLKLKALKIVEAEEFLEYAEEKILSDKWSPDSVVDYAKKYKLLKKQYSQRRFTIK